MTAAHRFRLAFAFGVVAGSVSAAPAIPVPVVVGLAGIALLTRRRAALVVVGLLLAASLSADARQGCRPPIPGPFRGTVVITTDPAQAGSAIRFDVRSDLGRLEVMVHGAMARRVADLTVGRRLSVVGTVRASPHPERVISRHVRGRLTVASMDVGSREPWSVPVDAVRGVVGDGSLGLPRWQRPLYRGFVIGDDRGVDDALVEDYRRAGLSHLLVVSGENVAFVLIVAMPLLSRLGRRRRLIATLVVLGAFVTLTRFEPSVLRAVAMAAVATVGVSAGRRVPGLVVLADAVGVLLLLDPLLIESLGFRLSVAATIGIVTMSGPIARRVPGPRWIATGVGVCVAAQLGVAPFVVPVFGPLRLVSVPANVLAEPAAAFVMMWGCTGGAIAGLVGGPFATVLQIPARLAIWWISSVAGVAARVPSPEFDLVGLVVIVVATMITMRVRRHVRHRSRGRGGVGVAV